MKKTDVVTITTYALTQIEEIVNLSTRATGITKDIIRNKIPGNRISISRLVNKPAKRSN